MKPPRPIKGSLEGSAYNREPGDEGFTCTQANAFVQTFTEATGQVSQLGRVSASLIHCGIAFDQAAGVITVEGQATFEAANGDNISGPFSGTVTLGETVVGALGMTVDGGTGRFDDASGKVDIGVVVGGETPTGVGVEMSLTGNVSY